VIQRLFATGLSLQSTIRITEKQEVAARLQQAIDDLDQTVRDIRSAIFELHTNTVPGRSTRQEVLEVCGDAARLLGFDPVVRFDGPIDTGLEERVAEHVLSVVREALSNVARHANATSVEVRVTARDGLLSVTVEDDGCGFAEHEPGPGGRGLTNMRSRAGDLDGTLDVSPAPDGTGTCLRWTVPIKPD
jgi:signal transduction histidine kinase